MVKPKNAKKIWRDNSTPAYWLGAGVGVGLLLPIIWVPAPLTQVTTGWSILVVSILGLAWIPVGDYARRRITWLPDPPTRPRILRGFSTSKGAEPPEMEDGDLWLLYRDK